MSRVSTTRYAERVETRDAPPPAVGLLDQILARPTAERLASLPLDGFLKAATVGEALAAWFARPPRIADDTDRQKLSRRLNAAVARVDELLSAQLDAVLHHPQFQKFEASWRGLKYLVEQVPDGANVKVRVLSASWKDLARDQERALEFDQSALFRKVYSDEFDTPGGEPFGLLVGDYDLTHRPFPDHPTDDLATLNGLAGVAAAAFAPFVCGVDPRFLELDSFADLDPTIDLARTFARTEYVSGRALRDTEDSRFVGLVIPKILLREPHTDSPGHDHRFQFREDATSPDRKGYLWGNGSFAMAAVAVRAFAESGWLAGIRGVRGGDAETAGRVTGLPALEFGPHLSPFARSVTDVHLTDRQEKELSDHGFVPLCHLPGSGDAAFYTTPSVQKPKSYDEPTATANARLSGMLQYMLCVSRIAHYLKAMIRDRVGAFAGAEECEDHLQQWFRRYVVSNDSAGDELKAKYPLREARAEVREVTGKPGAYRCSVYLRPHFQLDQLSAAIKLTTQLSARGTE
jgi:type VI secretion system ImpC/EvpB family protein